MNLRTLHSVSFACLAISFLITASSLQAGASNKNGNPFSADPNGSFFPSAGLFSGVLRGNNLVGITKFSTYSYPITTSNNITNYSTSFTNSSGSLIYLANGNLSSNAIVYALPDPYANTIQALIYPNNVTTVTVYTNTDSTTPYGSNNINLSVNQNSGQFLVQLSTKPPQQTFWGTGTMMIPAIYTFTGNPVTTSNAQVALSNSMVANPAAQQTSFSISGIRYSAAAGYNF